MKSLPSRSGPRPRATAAIPHQQLDQQPADPEVADRLVKRLAEREGIRQGDTVISLPGARAFLIDDPAPDLPRDAVITGAEFAHVHAAPDHSLHVALPAGIAAEAVRQGWAEPHPLAGKDGFGDGLVMIYAPRNDHEADVIEQLVDASYQAATGRAISHPSST